VTTKYETIVVGVPTMTDDEFSGILSSLQSTIQEGGGTVLQCEPWGKKRLAYRVQKFDEGYYALLFHQSPAPVVHEVERRIRMNERLMKFLTVKVDWEEKVARAAELKAARRPRTTPATRSDDDAGFDAPGDMDGGQ
jgi:small subunit ribosomal protein S6